MRFAFNFFQFIFTTLAGKTMAWHPWLLFLTWWRWCHSPCKRAKLRSTAMLDSAEQVSILT